MLLDTELAGADGSADRMYVARLGARGRLSYRGAAYVDIMPAMGQRKNMCYSANDTQAFHKWQLYRKRTCTTSLYTTISSIYNIFTRQNKHARQVMAARAIEAGHIMEQAFPRPVTWRELR